MQRKTEREQEEKEDDDDNNDDDYDYDEDGTHTTACRAETLGEVKRVHDKRSEDGIIFRENVRSRACARSASVRRADPLVLARVPGMGRLAACFPCSVFLDQPDFSLSRFISLPCARSFFLCPLSLPTFLCRRLARAHRAARVSVRLSFSPSSLPPSGRLLRPLVQPLTRERSPVR